MDVGPVIVIALSALLALLLCFSLTIARSRSLHLWLPAYLYQRISRLGRRKQRAGTTHVIFGFVDHFEPEWRKPGAETALARVKTWSERYPDIAAAHRDADGRPPVHTFFFPHEEYRSEYLDELVGLCSAGFAEVEVHLHHDNDTSAGLREKLDDFKKKLAAHDCLARDEQGNSRFAFIHGNWCLDNARPDGRWCGVNDEIRVLAESGCYADFTLPAVPNIAQTRQINSIYYAIDDPSKPKSHDRGEPARVGRRGRGELLLIQGILGLNWARRKWWIFPGIENSEICAANLPSKQRVDLWVNEGIGVQGRPEWIFVKVHSHGAGEAEFPVLLGQPMHEMFSHLESRYNDGKRYRLHYVSAREMYNVIRAAEDGMRGDPNLYRDYEIKRPGYGRDTERAPRQAAKVIELQKKSRMA